MYGLGDSELNGILLGQGLQPENYKTKYDKINILEKLRLGLEKEPLMIKYGVVQNDYSSSSDEEVKEK